MVPQPRSASARTGRGAATRDRILTSAVDIMAERGHAATNVQAICDRSGVARGSILHQFPNRVSLMRGLADHCAEGLLVGIRQSLNAEPTPLEKLHAYPDVIWNMSRTKFALSLAELQDAAHWDSELAELIRPASHDLTKVMLTDLQATAIEAGVTGQGSLAASLMLMIFSMRSLVIAVRLNGDDAFLQAVLARCVADWRNQLRLVLSKS